MTLILNAADVAGLLDPGVLLDALRSGFLAGGPSTGQRVRADLPGPGTATVLLPGLVDGIPAYTVKVNAKFPAARPALRGVVCLHSLEDGRLLAILDSASLTAWRTGLAAALATDVLAPPGAGTVGVVGAGAQAELVLAGLRRLRPVTRLTVTDLDQDRARRLAERHGGPGRADARADARVADGAREVAAASEIVVLATWSRAPLLRLADLRPGQHVTSLGVDEPGKAELARDVLRSATLVVDDEDLVRQAGVLAAEGLRDVRPALLGQVLAGTHPGRSESSELTVYAPVGLPWQDLVAAWAVYQAASRPGHGGHGAANPMADVDLLA